MWTRDGGGHWYQAQSPRPGGGFTVSCGNAQNCVSAAHYFYFTTQDGAANWQTHLKRGRDLMKVSCPSAATCYMIASSSDLASNGTPAQELFLSSGDGGRSWKETPITTAHGLLDGLSCPAAPTCLISDDAGQVLLTKDGGTSWQDRSIDTPGGAGPTVIDCPTPDLCYAGSTSGRIWVGRFSGSPSPS